MCNCGRRLSCCNARSRQPYTPQLWQSTPLPTMMPTMMPTVHHAGMASISFGTHALHLSKRLAQCVVRIMTHDQRRDPDNHDEVHRFGKLMQAKRRSQSHLAHMKEWHPHLQSGRCVKELCTHTDMLHLATVPELHLATVTELHKQAGYIGLLMCTFLVGVGPVGLALHKCTSMPQASSTAQRLTTLHRAAPCSAAAAGQGAPGMPATEQ